VFTLLSALCARVGGGGVIATALAFKITTAAFDLACGWAIYRLARAVGGADGLVALAVYAWNPLVLIESSVSAHNEPVMMALCLVGVLWTAQGRVMAGWTALLLSVMVKYVSGAVALLVAVRVVAAEPTWRRRTARAALLLLVGVALLAAFYAPFWRGTAGFKTVIDLVTRGRAIKGESGAHGAGPLVLIAYAALGATGAFLACRGPWSWVLDLSAALSLAFVLVFPWMLPWYFTPAIALAAGAARTPANRALLVTSCSAAALTMLAYVKLLPLGP